MGRRVGNDVAGGKFEKKGKKADPASHKKREMRDDSAFEKGVGSLMTAF